MLWGCFRGIEREQKSFASVSASRTHISVSPLELCQARLKGSRALGPEVVCIKLRVGGWFCSLCGNYDSVGAFVDSVWLNIVSWQLETWTDAFTKSSR